VSFCPGICLSSYEAALDACELNESPVLVGVDVGASGCCKRWECVCDSCLFGNITLEPNETIYQNCSSYKVYAKIFINYDMFPKFEKQKRKISKIDLLAKWFIFYMPNQSPGVPYSVSEKVNEISPFLFFSYFNNIL
jgi:hypothetical protein